MSRNGLVSPGAHCSANVRQISVMIIVSMVAVCMSYVVCDTDTSSADDASGTTGECTWSFLGSAMMISGEGSMDDYASASSAPWSGFSDSIKAVIIMPGVTSIGAYAFAGCANLERITFSGASELTIIGEGAFSGCTSLKSLTVPDLATSIGDKAFSGCSSLQTVSLPMAMSDIGTDAFSGCSSLSKVDFRFDILLSSGDKAESFDSSVIVCSVFVAALVILASVLAVAYPHRYEH